MNVLTMATNSVTTFSEIFKSGFLDKVDAVSMLDMGLAMVLSFVLGLFILWVYRKTFKGVLYSASFGLSLMAMCLITTLVILAVTSNVVLSLGMVGALSIVRFRSAIKDPMDIAYMFWAIGVGIVVGAGLIPLAIFGSAFIGIILLVFVKQKTLETPYMLVVKCEDDQAEKSALNLIQSKVRRFTLKSKTISAERGIELTMEIRLKEQTSGFVNELSALPKVSSAIMVSYNGEYVA